MSMVSIHFNNGTYEFTNNKFIKIEREHLSTNYDYVEYKGDEPIFNEINEYFEKLFKNKDERVKMLTFLSHRISGDIDEKCNVIYGPAKNGKSVFILMIRKLFGDFAKIITSDNVNEDDKLLHSRHLHIMESPADETMIKFVNNHCQDPAFSFLFVCNSKPDFNKFEEKVNYFNFIINLFIIKLEKISL